MYLLKDFCCDISDQIKKKQVGKEFDIQNTYRRKARNVKRNSKLNKL